jgi:hypothetical protein
VSSKAKTEDAITHGFEERSTSPKQFVPKQFVPSGRQNGMPMECGCQGCATKAAMPCSRESRDMSMAWRVDAAIVLCPATRAKQSHRVPRNKRG